MKIRGMLIIFLISMVIVLFIFYGRMGKEKAVVEVQIEKAKEAKVSLTRTTLETLAREITSISAENGLPARLSEIRRMRPQFFVPFDACGGEIGYEVISENGFRLTSAGPDRALGTADDISKEF